MRFSTRHDDFQNRDKVYAQREQQSERYKEGV